MVETFEFLPLAATINGAFFAVHAGLSPGLHFLSQINALSRFSEFPDSQACIFADLLWSDPSL